MKVRFTLSQGDEHEYYVSTSKSYPKKQALVIKKRTERSFN